jgi:tetratricopeptide (TPR) repeat protein
MPAPRHRQPPPQAAAYERWMDFASDPTKPADQRVQAAMNAGDLTAPRAPIKAIDAYRLAASIDPLDGRPAIAAATLIARRGDWKAARIEAGQAFRTSLDEVVRADAAFLLGEVALACEQLDEAQDAFAAAAQLFERVHARDRQDPAPLNAIARLHMRQADMALNRGNHDSAQDHAARAAAILDGLQSQFPKDPKIMADARACLDRQIDLAMARNDAPTAAAWLDRLLPLALAAHADAPDDQPVQRNLGLVRLKHSLVSERLHDFDAALESADAAIGLLADLAAKDRDAAVLGQDLGRAMRRRADIALSRGEAGLAAAIAFQAGELFEQWLRKDPDAVSLMRDRAGAAVLEGDAAMQVRAYDQAGQAFTRARDLCLKGVSLEPDTATWPPALATAWDRIGDANLQKNEARAAAEAYAESLNVRSRLPDQQVLATLQARAITAAKLADAASRAGLPRQARVAAHTALLARQAIAAARPDDLAARDAHARALQRFGVAALAIGEHDDARMALEDSLALLQHCPVWEDNAPESRRRRAKLWADLASLGDDDAAHFAAQALTLLESLIAQNAAEGQDIALRNRLLKL